jgi:hypothetical protein
MAYSKYKRWISGRINGSQDDSPVFKIPNVEESRSSAGIHAPDYLYFDALNDSL